MRIRRVLLSSLTASAVLASGLALVAAPGAAASPWDACVQGSTDRQDVFARAAQAGGVPQSVLMAVSYLGSRWEAHAGEPSTSGGYGPMHLVDGTLSGVDPRPALRGEDAVGSGVPAGPLQRGAELTGFSEDRLRNDDVANICAGAAVLADYQRDLAASKSDATDPSAWTPAIATYGGATDEASANRYADQVFALLRKGERRTTTDGERLRLAAEPDARTDRAAIAALGLEAAQAKREPDCPSKLRCTYIEAPYEWYDEASPANYGNHDLADRPNGAAKIQYIVIHDTEASWETTLDLVQDPEYVSWQYSLRSSDGRIAQHVPLDDVAWHAGNWYVNAHSIGLEHEGFAAEGGRWYTESMYQTSAKLVRYLAKRYDVPLDRAHIIGHDQVPGTTTATVKGMHWDPGPYWDWEHYFDLLGAPIAKDGKRPPVEVGDVVTVAPGFKGNSNEITSCGDDPCVTKKSNFVYLHTEPNASSPLVKDPGLHDDDSYSTTHVSDIGARAAAGQKLVVAEKDRSWLGVWYLGELGWLRNPKKDPAVAVAKGRQVTPIADAEVPVYGRAYPEEAAYPEAIPYQTVSPLAQYTLKPGQAYAVADRTVATDYYYAKSYNCAYVEMDCTNVVGTDVYYQIWLGHRLAFVRAADVALQPLK